jgi:leucyl-tRNA synthetase
MAFSDKVSDQDSEEAFKLGHRLVHGVEKDIEGLQFNTAIAKMMEFINDFTKLSGFPRSVILMATQALAPFAPHLAEEVWQHLGKEEELSYSPYPIADENYLREDVVTVVIQVNGKLRGRLELPRGEEEADVLEAARKHHHLLAYLDGKEIQKTFYVPNKLLNIVLKP